MSDQSRHVKVCIVGETSVGKTCIINRTIQNTFSQDVRPTVADVYQYHYQKDGCNIEFEIWDTAGQVSFRSLVPMYWQNANVIIVVYDITNKDSFEALEGWTQFIPEHIFKSSVVLLVGNKLDLKDKRVVELSKADDFSSFRDFSQYFEVSALTGEGISDVWRFIAETPEIQDIPIGQQLPPPGHIPETDSSQSPDEPQAGENSQGFISSIVGYLYGAYEYVKSFF